MQSVGGRAEVSTGTAALEALVTESVVKGVKRDLAEVKKVAPDLAASGLAMTALAMAREIDAKTNSATSKSMCAKALAGALAELRALMPDGKEADQLDDLSARRAARLAGSAKT